MDIRSLACFVAVADDLHFGRAAERLHMTQPALSQRIRALEETVGAVLLHRDRRHVSLTPAGSAFLGPARAAVANATQAKSAALRALRGETGRLRLGFTVIAFFGVLPEAVRRYRSRFPDVVVELTELNSPLLEQALASGELDLGVLHPPLNTASLSCQDLPAHKLLLALPAEHPLASQACVRVADLKDQPLLIAPRRVGPHLYDKLIAMFRNEGISPTIVQDVTPMTTLAGLVSAGAGLGFVTEGLAAAGRPGVVFRPVSPALPDIPVAAAWVGEQPSIPATRFLEVVAGLLGDGQPGRDGLA